MGFSHIYSLDGLSNIFVFKGRVLEVAPSVGTVVRTSIPRKEPLITRVQFPRQLVVTSLPWSPPTALWRNVCSSTQPTFKSSYQVGFFVVVCLFLVVIMWVIFWRINSYQIHGLQIFPPLLWLPSLNFSYVPVLGGIFIKYDAGCGYFIDVLCQFEKIFFYLQFSENF